MGKVSWAITVAYIAVIAVLATVLLKFGADGSIIFTLCGMFGTPLVFWFFSECEKAVARRKWRARRERRLAAERQARAKVRPAA